MPPNPIRIVRNDLLSDQQSCTLRDGAFVCETDKREIQIPFAEIAKINLITYAGLRTPHGQCTVHGSNGTRVKFRSHHFSGLANFENRSETYAAFVKALCVGTHAASPLAKFSSGSTAYLALWLFVFASTKVVALFVVAAMLTIPLSFGTAFGCLLVVGGCTWLSLRWIRRNRTRTFDPQNVPDELLPRRAECQ